MTNNSKPRGALPKGFEPKKESDSDKIQKSIKDLSLKIDEQKKEHQENKNKEYEFQGKVAKENIWSVNVEKDYHESKSG